MLEKGGETCVRVREKMYKKDSVREKGGERVVCEREEYVR